MKKIAAYRDQTQNTFMLEKIKEVRSERDQYKNRYEVANMYRALWKISTLILSAIFIGRILGGTL